MDKDNDQNQNSAGVPGGEKNDMGGTLDMKDISVSTLDDDIKKQNPDKAKSNWFGFLSKHQTGDQASSGVVDSDNTQEENSQLGAENQSLKEKSFLEQEMDQFKDKISAKETAETPVREENKTAGEGSNINEEAENDEDFDENLSEPLPSLSFGEKSEEKEEKTTPVKETVEEVSQTPETVLSAGLTSTPQATIEGKDTETSESGEEDQNPFGVKIESPKPEKKSLLSSVESALNYSASPEFAESREKIEEALREEQEQSKVVDLRKKEDQTPSQTNPPANVVSGGKKMWLIGGGILGLAALLIGGLIWFMLGKSSSGNVATPQNVNNNNKNSGSQSNSNFTVKPTVQVNTALSPKTVLANTQEVNIKDGKEIVVQIEKIRQDKTLKGQVQLIFLKPDGSTISFEELMDGLNFNIPSRILLEPSKEVALVFADSFQDKRIFGLIIPTSEDDKTVLDKMKIWESSLTTDLTFLWESLIVDNRGAYFADTTLFKNSRYAVIDKKTGLSMNYSVKNGYIFIACGKDSLGALEKNFNASQTTTGASSSSGSSDQFVSASPSANSNSNLNNNSNLNSNFNSDSSNSNFNADGLSNNNSASVTPFDSQ